MSSMCDELLPIVPYLVRGTNGEPGLRGSKCGSCHEVFLGSRKVCARCSARNGMTPVDLSNSGKLYNYTVVHRSRPGVVTPFVSAIVELDGGGILKGTLEAPVNEVRFDMPVKVMFKKADQVDAKGRSYLTYYFARA